MRMCFDLVGHISLHESRYMHAAYWIMDMNDISNYNDTICCCRRRTRTEQMRKMGLVFV